MYPSMMQDLVTVEVHKNIQRFTSVSTDATIDLSRLPDGVRSQTLTNLRRGSASALSGEAAMVYHLLASAYDIPVFSVGRSDQCILSFRMDTDGTIMRTKVVEDIEAMWRLAFASNGPVGYRPYFRISERHGHRKGWVQIQSQRPAAMTLQSLLTMMGVETIWDVVPKDHCQKAMMAVERGDRIVINRTDNS